jgi:hypothetical protein
MCAWVCELKNSFCPFFPPIQMCVCVRVSKVLIIASRHFTGATYIMFGYSNRMYIISITQICLTSFQATLWSTHPHNNHIIHTHIYIRWKEKVYIKGERKYMPLTLLIHTNFFSSDSTYTMTGNYMVWSTEKKWPPNKHTHTHTNSPCGMP